MKNFITFHKEKQKQNEADWNAYLRSPQGAIQLSNDAKSINEEKEAIQFLIAARDNLSKSTQDYDKIIKEFEKQKEDTIGLYLKIKEQYEIICERFKKFV